MLKLNKHTRLHFQCTACGKCCTGGDDHYIAMSPTEAEKIRTHLGVSRNWFQRRYVTHLTRDTLTARMLNGRCVFLDKKGQCKIYLLRPTQCRTYPYWPEILESKTSWDNEAHYCEGINSGSVVTIKEIKAKLTQQLRAEKDT